MNRPDPCAASSSILPSIKQGNGSKTAACEMVEGFEVVLVAAIRLQNSFRC